MLSGADGSFEIWLPASGDAEYNLTAHDGGFREWRNWANGVLDPIKTKPGDIISDVTITLTRPCSVSGTVRDIDGNPLKYHEVEDTPSDFKGNRYYEPFTLTDEHGRYTLHFIRPGEHYIEASPYALHPEEAPENICAHVTLKAGQALENVDLIGETF